jgi:succinate-semialdehyde dehydrogenase / glutarate-semialdehyde dehydrogenase
MADPRHLARARDFLRMNGCLIDGRLVAGSASIDVSNPATGEIIGRVADAGAPLTRDAIAAAHAAFATWKTALADHRAAILREIARRLRDEADALACLLTLEQGKPLSEARGEVLYAASYFDWFAGEAVRVGGRTIPASAADKRLFTAREPVGVCAAITPWNFPIAMLARKMAAALAAGCTLVAKPDHHTPFCALALGQMALDAGLPAGVVNIVTGRSEPIGEAIMASDVVRKVSFTGSTPVGKLLMRQAADTLKRLTLELGGNAPFIVCEDADVDAAVSGAMQSKYRNAGQTCVCANRFIVHESVEPEFVRRLAEASARLKLGDGLEDGVTLGPLIDDRAVEKVKRLVDDAVAGGARIAFGVLPDGASRFVPPLILTGVDPRMQITREEIFGPVCAVETFREDAEALDRANAAEYGLAAYLYTASIARAIRLTEGLQAGIIGVNTGLISTAQAPFGGVKHSGFGREGGAEGIEEYLDVKYVCVGV